MRINVFIYVQYLGNKKCRPSPEGDRRKKRNVTTDDTPFLYKVSLILKDLVNI